MPQVLLLQLLHTIEPPHCAEAQMRGFKIGRSRGERQAGPDVLQDQPGCLEVCERAASLWAAGLGCCVWSHAAAAAAVPQVHLHRPLLKA